MAILSLALGIILLLLVPMAWTTMGAIRSGFIFAIISIVLIILANVDKSRPKLSTAAIVINIISVVLNGLIAFAFTI